MFVIVASDKKNNCFVCGNTRLDFSKAGINFDNHIEDKHDAWKYIYYILYLEYKGESELSGLEYFVWGQIQAKKTNWIPIGNTLTICRSLTYCSIRERRAAKVHRAKDLEFGSSDQGHRREHEFAEQGDDRIPSRTGSEERPIPPPLPGRRSSRDSLPTHQGFLRQCLCGAG